MPTVSITESNVLAALRAFILTLVSCEVVRGLDNEVPMPAGGFIELTPALMTPLSTTVVEYDDSDPTASLANFKGPLKYSVQVDCYGTVASDWAAAIVMALRTPYACDSFAASGFDIQPLYADDPKQLSFVDEGNQFVERWVFNAVLQYNPVIIIPMQSMTQISLGPSIVAGDPVVAGEIVSPGTVSVDRS